MKDRGYDAFHLEDFYIQPNNYSYDHFTCLEKLTLTDFNVIKAGKNCEFDEFINLEDVAVSTLVFKTIGFFKEDFMNWMKDLKINQNVQEITIIFKTMFDTYEEINLFKDEFSEKIKDINPNIKLNIISGNISSSVSLIHHIINVNSEFYSFFYAIEMSKKKKLILQKLHKFPILRTLNQFFNSSYCSFDVYVKKLKKKK